MKARALSAIILLAVGLFVTSILRAKEFAAMSLEEAKEAIDKSHGQQSKSDLVEAAVKSKRFDLISLCFERADTAGETRMATNELPDSLFKDRLVLMMMKGGRAYWPGPYEVSNGLISVGDLMSEPFTSVLHKYLPDAKLENKLLEIPELRLKLASDLAGAMIQKGAEPTGQRNAPNPPHSPKSGSEDGSTGSASSKVVAVPPKPIQSTIPPQSPPYLKVAASILLVVIAVASLVWVVSRRKSRK